MSVDQLRPSDIPPLPCARCGGTYRHEVGCHQPAMTPVDQLDHALARATRVEREGRTVVLYFEDSQDAEDALAALRK